MFTGIVEGTGVVSRVTEGDDGRRLRVETDLGPFAHGQSVSVSGACLTVEDSGALRAPEQSSGERSDPRDESGPDYFEVFIADETLRKTYLGDLREGDAVNLERAMPADGRFDGHLVQGHVDTVTEVVGVEQVGEDWTFAFALPEGFEQYVVPKGSIALDGVSLTVADLDDGRGSQGSAAPSGASASDDAAGTFSVAVIPTTYDRTTLSGKEPGDPVHVEVDVLAKYVERMLDYS